MEPVAAAPCEEEVLARLGVTRLRTEQREAIDLLRAGRNVIAVLPTGSGKSAIYQVAAETMPGPTIVVGPLLALQDDQLESVRSSDLSHAARLDGSTTESGRRDVLDRFAHGDLEYLFVTPETLESDDVISAAKQAEVSLFVVDEAHCVTTWGRGFRPAFGRLGELRTAVGDPICLALTASADERMRDDIGALLGLRDPATVLGAVVRPEINLGVQHHRDDSTAEQAVIDEVTACSAKTLVYVPRRRLTEELAGRITDAGRGAAAYHGGLSADRRQEVSAWFGATSDAVVVATDAFGMGIDVPDVGSVLHLDLPPTLVDLYQEVGRGGRDGREVSAVAHVVGGRASRRRFSAGVRTLDPAACDAVASAIRNGRSTRRAIRTATSLGSPTIAGAVAVLRQAGAIDRDSLTWIGSIEPDDETITELCDRRNSFHRAQSAAVETYASGVACRWAQVAAALGDTAGPCGSCDVCERGGSAPTDGADEQPATHITHPVFGDGIVCSDDGEVMTVSFPDAGPRRLRWDLVDEIPGVEISHRRA